MSNKLSQKLSLFYNSNKFPWLIICVGVAFRLIRYSHNSSLWFDESRNAIGIINRSFSELVIPASNQTLSLPLGFYILEKFAIKILGNSEYAFKLFPLLFGIASLVLFYNVAKQYIKPKAIPIALGLFAVLEPLVDSSSAVKPYSCDVAIALFLYAITKYIQSRKLNTLQAMLLGGIGATTALFSHPSVFIMVGIGTTMIISCAVKKEWSKMRGLLITFLIWGSGFLAVFFIYTRPLMYNFTLTNDSIFWMKAKGFMPFPPMSLSDIQWFLDLPQRIFAFPIGLTFSGIGTLTFLAGCITIFLGKKEHFFILISPLIFTLLASAFHKYVFSLTPILFLVPFIILIIAEGTEYIREKISFSSQVIGIILVGLLFLHPLSWAAYNTVKPSSREEIKPVLAHIKNNWKSGDILYVYYMTQFAFEYYSKYHPGNYHFSENEYIIGRGPQDWYATYKRKDFKGFWNPDRPFSQPYNEIFKGYIEDLNKLKGNKRVWVLFSSMVSKDGIHEEKFFQYHLETIGKKLDSFGQPGVSAVYLYDLSIN